MTVMLYIDQGTACGFAVGAPGEVVSGEWDLSRTKHDSWAMTPIKLKRELKRLHDATGFTHLGYEKIYRHAGVDAAHLNGALMAAAQEFCISHGITHEAVGVGELKKFWTGKGNAKKPDMIRAAQERGFYPDTDNEADAIAGWHWLQAQATLDHGVKPSAGPSVLSEQNDTPSKIIPSEAAE